MHGSDIKQKLSVGFYDEIKWGRFLGLGGGGVVGWFIDLGALSFAMLPVFNFAQT